MPLPPFTIPSGVGCAYVDDPHTADAEALIYFPRNGTVRALSIDVELEGDMASKGDVQDVVLPYTPPSTHIVRLVTIASENFVVAFDLRALNGVLPPRTMELLGDPSIPKTGFHIIMDCTAIGRVTGAAVLNAVDLSCLIKTVYPSVLEYPLSRQISLQDGAARILGRFVDKSLQHGNWAAPVLTQQQLDYAYADAAVGIAVYTALLPRIAQNSPFFDASAYSFNTAFVINGQVVPPGPATTGATHRSWGVTRQPPLDKKSGWKPSHVLLDRWDEPRYRDMRDMSALAYYTKQAHLICGAVLDTAVYTGVHATRYAAVAPRVHWRTFAQSTAAFVLVFLVYLALL